MRILYLNPSGTMGGAEVALIDMLASVREAQPGWELNLIASAEGPVATKARALGVGTTVIPFPRSLVEIGDSSAGKQNSHLSLLQRLLLAGPGIVKYMAMLRKSIRKFAPSVIHSNGFKMHILGALAKPSDTPIIWHIHDYLSSRPFMARLVKQFQNHCSLIIANSNSVKFDIEAVCGRKTQVQTIYNVVNTDVFSPLGEILDLDRLSGLPPTDQDVVRVGLLATFARWKGHEVFLKALSLIPPEIPFRAYIIGDALYETSGSQYSMHELKSKAQEFGVFDRVGFTGFIDQPAAAIRSLDIVIHASTQPEPFGLVITEGMSCGRAVIASFSGGACELVDDGINALAHPTGSASGLAKQFTVLARDHDLRRRLGDAGRATAEAVFARSRFAEELVPIYRSATRDQSSNIYVHDLVSPGTR